MECRREDGNPYLFQIFSLGSTATAGIVVMANLLEHFRFALGSLEKKALVLKLFMPCSYP